MTLPDRVRAALDTEAGALEMEAPEFLRTFLVNAAQSPGGAMLKLNLPPFIPDPLQPLLPLTADK